MKILHFIEIRYAAHHATWREENLPKQQVLGLLMHASISHQYLSELLTFAKGLLCVRSLPPFEPSVAGQLNGRPTPPRVL